MDQKTIAWVSYLTLVGWIVALVLYNQSPDKSSLARFHLRQSFGLLATGFVAYIAIIMMAFVLPFLFFISWILWVALFVFWILGLISAINGEEKPLPVVGEFYQKTFTFIN
jgi:uncharacterized membrane protein